MRTGIHYSRSIWIRGKNSTATSGRNKPDVLYRIWFYLSIPYSPESFETPKIHSEILASDVEDVTSGIKKVEFLTIEHGSGMLWDDEMILTGRGKIGNGKLDYTIRSANLDHVPDSKIKSHKMSNNVYVISTQFDSPYAYSTSTWVDGNNCHKNITRFSRVEKHLTGMEDISVAIRNDREPYEFLITTLKKSPQLRFTLPGNTSARIRKKQISPASPAGIRALGITRGTPNITKLQSYEI